MKNSIVVLFLLSIALFSACSKEDTTPTGNNLNFISLTATDTLIKVNGLTTITANAAGDGLTYNWSANYGTFVGSGQQVQWTVCHKDKFTITCEIKDQNNQSQKKQIVIRSQY